VKLRSVLIGVGVVAALVGLVFLYDVLVVTDEERIEEFVADVTGTVSPTRVHRARTRWVDLSRQPIRATVYGQALAWDEDDEARLEEEADERLRTIEGSRTRTMGSTIEIEGDHATVSLRVVSDRLGLANIEWQLEKHDDDWLVSRLSVQRGSLAGAARPARARGGPDR
jgi:hypothetical protein